MTIVLSLLCVQSFAENTEFAEEGTESTLEGENASKKENGTEGEISPPEKVSFFDRVTEFLSGDNLTQTVIFVYNVFCTVILLAMRKSSKLSSADLAKLITANSKTSHEKMNQIADGYNSNEKEVAALKEEIAKLREEHKIKTVSMEQFTAALEGIRDIGLVLQTVYQNSSTIPQVIKTSVMKKVSELNEIIDEAEKNAAEG